MKILTWNIANYNDHPFWEERISLIVEEIIRLNPDVVALQEVRYCADTSSSIETGMNTAEQILYALNEKGFALGYDIAIAPAMYYNHHEADIIRKYPCKASMNKEHRVIWEGLAIISKEPILEHVNLILNPNPPAEDTNIRNLQMIKTGSLHLLNTHLSFNPKEALQNTREMFRYIDERNLKTYLLCGDFNSTPTSEVVEYIKSRGLQKLTPSRLTHPIPDSIVEIDYIFGFNLSRESKIVYSLTNYKNTGVYPSDHIGIMITM